MHKRTVHDVAIFWDYENCPPPANASGWETVKAIRHTAQAYGCIKLFRAYLELPAQVSSPDSRSFQLRSELQSSGVSLTDCPHNGRKDVADKMILVDMMAHAIDNPAPWTYILISGDRDFAYAISVLNLRRYQMILVSPSTAHISLKSQATACLDWNRIIDKSTTGSTRKPVMNQEPLLDPRHTPTNGPPLSSERSFSRGDTHGGPSMDEVDIINYLRTSRRRRQLSLSSDASHSVISDFRNDSTTHTAYFSASETLASPPPVFSARRHGDADSTTNGYALSPDNDKPTSSPSNPSHSIPIPAHGISVPSLNPRPIKESSGQAPPEIEPGSSPQPPPPPVSTPSIPRIFVPLVNLLRSYMAKGSSSPSRDDLARELDQNTNIYTSAKVERIGQYIALAERHRIIIQGPGGIVLRPEWS